MIAIDTNLLIYAHRSAVAQHNSARKAIERASQDGGGWGISLPALAEFWSVVTHPKAGRPSTTAEASGFIHSLVLEGEAHIWMPGPGFAERLIQLAGDLRVFGARIFDLQIALVAFDNGAHELWTHDSSFVAIPGLHIIHPLA